MELSNKPQRAETKLPAEKTKLPVEVQDELCAGDMCHNSTLSSMDSICFYLVALLAQSFLALSAKVVTNFTTDQSALFEFKSYITSDDPHNILVQNWSASIPMCQWIGVTCGARHRRVTALTLPNMRLQGTISPYLGNLSFLISLNISFNNFHGPIPVELGKLPRLKRIVLSNNSFSGIIPRSIFNMSKLETLNLRYNVIEGILPFEEALLPNLKVLDVRGNRLSGSLPDDMCKRLPQLENLSLDTNELKGQLPTSLEACNELQVLSLGNNSFVGTIPTSIGNLTKLKELYLNNNMLSGYIPDEVGNLVELEVLTLNNAGVLTGEIPSFIFNMSSLKKIGLNNIGLYGSLPKDICQHLPILTILGIGGNMLTNGIPKDIGNCTLLEALGLGGNYLAGEIPKEVGNLKKLEILILRSCHLTGIIPSSIFNISTLKVLSLYENNLTGNLPPSIGLTLPNLMGLYLWENNLSGPIPSSVSNASKLTQVDISVNYFTGYIPTTLGNLRSLQSLLLQDNELVSDPSSPELPFLSSLTNCVNLQYLAIADNPLNDFLPSSIGNFSKALEYVYAYNCRLKGGIPVEIGNLSNLISITFADNELTGSVPTTISRLQKLQAVSLRHNKLQGQIPLEFCQLQRMDVLALGNNMLNGSIPACIGNMTTLRYLYLNSNRLSSTIPSTIWNLAYILEVLFDSNSLGGYLSFKIGSLKVLTSIDMSKNQLSGNIPSSIGGLTDLKYLSLAENGFEGSIPESFGGLTSLETLDVSRNKLSGVIPKQLEELKFLSNFNVSFNRFQGRIPEGGPFVNFSAQSFLSNDELCGLPRFQVPPCKLTRTGQSKQVPKLLLKYVFPAIGAAILVASLISILVRFCKTKDDCPPQGILLPHPNWRRISYHDLQQATDGFDEGNLLGTGGFGSVYKGTLSDGTEIAIKVFNLQFEGAFGNFEAECEVMRSIRHRNLVKVISSCSNNIDFKALVLELMPNGSLNKWLYSQHHFLDIVQRLDILENVASALEYLHQGYSTPVIHCDLKPSNILLDEDMVAHVADFGIAKLLGEGEDAKQTMTLATIGYMAPEYGLLGIISTSCDVYAFGIVMMETFMRKNPTDEMFVGEMNLRRWVKESLAVDLAEVADADLLKREDEHFVAKLKCVSSLMELAFACTEESPQGRTNMCDALVMLKKIKKKLLKEIKTRPRMRQQ
ncbi:probable LRR receptor-like serine/threonine-protein kinase At3g47570 [Tripterygium wilfordii]|uniref:probable LRR receptor-like serine/threonine-protein kinase At3g47570 n=1 Tax=Tripterygium wilfordii TaxID=458696 RepID=UPI0018F85BD5|nr:probable LRR receptor-like serine/threonine-protein kinase At3g47570 [Tripterygium wilfordii]